MPAGGIPLIFFMDRNHEEARTMKTRFWASAVIVVLAVFALWGAAQQSAGELFQSGLYKEQVEGKLEEAIAIYDEIARKYPEERAVAASAYYHLGLCCEKLGRTRAAEAFTAVLEKYPDQAETARLARERLSVLAGAESRALAEADSQAERLLDRGNELFNRWDYESAVKEYERAVRLRPNSLAALNAQYCIGQAWYKAGKYDKALQALTNLMAEHPRSSIAPVTELMISQVRNAMKNAAHAESTVKPRENTLVDPGTGITFRRVKSLSGESDIITFTNGLNLSPNGKFLLSGSLVVPMDGSAPFELVNFRETGIQATRATWSPDGTKAAFYSGDALCVVPASPETGRATGPYKKIHLSPLKWQSNPEWSPDAKKLTFQATGDLWMIDSDGTNLRKITTSQGPRMRAPAWSPDGKTIAYGTWPKNAIGLYDIESGRFTELTETGYRCAPTWSPDGNWIVGSWDKLYFYSRDHKAEFDYSPPKEVGTLFSLRKDGRMLFFRGSYFANTGLRVASSGGGPSFEPVPLLTNWGTARWSADGKLIGVQGEDDAGKIAVSIVPLAGGSSRLIDLDNLVEGKPFPFAFSSDLSKVLFSVQRADGKKDLFAVQLSHQEAKTTGPAVKIFDGWRMEGAYNIVFSLSPDGEKAAFLHDEDIWLGSTNGGGAIKIPQKAAYLRWTDNGKALLLGTVSGWSLLEDPGPQGRLIDLLDDGKKIDCPWSNIDIAPDNSSLAYSLNGRIRIVPLDGKGTARTLDIGELRNCGYLAWSPDGRDLAFIEEKETDDPVGYPDGRYHIYKISRDGGKPVRVASDDDYPKGEISWSPDGKWLAYSVDRSVKVRPESTIWAVDFEEILKKR
jgi:Tol biopolymer transport system component/TolA-binding protein